MAFIAGIAVGGFFVGAIFSLAVWMVAAYKKHPEWFDEDWDQDIENDTKD